MEPYVVRQGDYLQSIAHRLGFDANEVWNDEKNERLRKQGRKPHLLQPCDVLFVPEAKRKWLPLKLGTLNTFAARTSVITLSLMFHARRGEPLANAACRYDGLLNVDGAPTSTDGSGGLTLNVSTRQPPFAVVFADIGSRFMVLAGHMDPVEERSGVQKRLGHLGYGASPILELADNVGAHRAGATAVAAFTTAFQLDRGLTTTGELDAAAVAQLVSEHGV